MEGSEDCDMEPLGPVRWSLFADMDTFPSMCLNGATLMRLFSLFLIPLILCFP
jgi:hypothetical protein